MTFPKENCLTHQNWDLQSQKGQKQQINNLQLCNCNILTICVGHHLHTQ